MAGKYRQPLAKTLLESPERSFTTKQLAELLDLNVTYVADALCVLTKDLFCTSTKVGHVAHYRLNPDRPELSVERFITGAAKEHRKEQRREYMRTYNRVKSNMSPERIAELERIRLGQIPKPVVKRTAAEPKKRGVGTPLTITKRDDSPLSSDERRPETFEEFRARGGVVEVLSHSFDRTPDSWPGRKPIRKSGLTFAN